MVKRNPLSQTVDVTADGVGLISHAGAFLVTELADRIGLTGALSQALAGATRRTTLAASCATSWCRSPTAATASLTWA